MSINLKQFTGPEIPQKESLYPIFVFMNYYTIVYTGIKEKGFLFGSLFLSFKFGKSDTTDGARSCSVVIPGLRALNIIAAAGVNQ